MKTINIRRLKDHLSACLREVSRGETYRITDRGEVVAELSRPIARTPEQRIQRLVEAGVLRAGTPSPRPADVYEAADVGLSAAEVDSALEWARGER